MQHTSAPSRRPMAAALALLSIGAVVFAARPAGAHEAKCPYCKLDVVQDTPSQDNEVALRYGRKRIEYRCVFCAIAQKDKFAGDLSILAPTEAKGKYVTITRKDGKWSAPAGTVFVAEKANHRYCQVTYRAFTGRAAFDAYVRRNGAQVKGAKPVTLDQMVAIAR